MAIQYRRKNDLKESKVRYLLPRNNGEISNSITQNWTDQAILCYKSNFGCHECSINKANYSFVCQMPNVVKKLLEDLGPPEQERIEKLNT